LALNVIVYRLTKSAAVGERGAKPDMSSRFSYVAVAGKSVPIAVQILFLLFVFTLPFEEVDLGFMTGSVSIAKLAGFLFFGCYFFYHNPLFQKGSFPHIPHALWWFAGYFVIWVVELLLVPEEFRRTMISLLFTLAQLLVFFWIASDLLKDGNVARRVLLVYAIASALFAVAMMLGLPGFSEDIGQGRATAFGENANVAGQHLALCVLIVVGLILNKTFKHFVNKVLLILLSVPLAIGLVSTGSRGAVVALVIGCFAYLIPYWRSRQKLISIVFAILVLASVTYMIASNPDFSERWSGTYYEGDLTGRDIIYAAAGEMISERPLFGWNPVEAFYELARRVAWPSGARDAHNTFLTVALGVGLLGAIPFLMGLWTCIRAAWKARSGNLGLLPLALAVNVFAASMSTTLLNWKPFWLVLALTLAATSLSGASEKIIARLTGRAVENK
jgi:O-antigen ligase